ncbi:MAG: hypothetical protein MJZ99_06255 [Bacteroidales bacterium]|nr:hypothetical protein [Bacteroidales bacterium]
MKKISILCAALAVAALSFTSCQKEESTTNNQKFIASFEQAGNDKFYVDADLQMYWHIYGWNDIAVYAPGFVDLTGYSLVLYRPSSISADGKVAVLEQKHQYGIPDVPADQQGPFYAISDAISRETSHINSDGSFHVGAPYTNLYYMPMVGRAENFGTMQFKHILGILKVYVNLPEGYTASDVNMRTVNPAYNPTVINSCDVTWDANGEITLSNIEKAYTSYNSFFFRGNGYFYRQVCPGDWTKILFYVDAQDGTGNGISFFKAMNDNASIHIERAGITTITLNITMDDVD